MEIREQVPLAPLTTFRIGGPARYFAEANDRSEIREALQWAQAQKVPYRIIAGGSNILVPDEGVDALVIHINGSIYGTTGEIMEADAGCNLLDLIHASAAANLSGWERMAGIPGTIGGAIRGNAGAFGTEIAQVLFEVEALNMETGSVRVFQNADCDFSYRSSFFKKHPEWIILRAKVRLAPGDRHKSEQLITETIAERERRHLQNVRAAGSFFMNPHAPPELQQLFEKEKRVAAREGCVPAGWLIERAGMKGFRIGGAIASEQHPNYLVSDGATAHDIRALAHLIQKEVKRRFGIELAEEVGVW